MHTLNENLESLNHLRFFKYLKEEERELIEENGEIITFKKNDYIYERGNQAEAIYWLIEGRVRLFNLLEDGTKIYFDLRCDNQLFGEDCLFEKEILQNFAQAIDKEVTVLKVWRKDLSALNLEQLKVEVLKDRLNKSNEKVQTLLTKDAFTRVKEFLFNVATERGRQVGHEYYLPNVLCHYDIAGYMHISRQTVSHFLNQLQRDGVITMDRNNILIRDLSALN